MTGLPCSTRRAFQSTVFTADHGCNTGPGSSWRYCVFTNTERLALAGFLAGYSGLTRPAYELDLRQYASARVVRRVAVAAAQPSAHA